MKYRREYNPKIIGRNLKRLRESKKLTVDEVRQYLRLGTTQAIYKYESGNGYPQADTMLALMELYDAELHDIVDDHEGSESFDNVKIATTIFRHRNVQRKRLQEYYKYFMEHGYGHKAG